MNAPFYKYGLFGDNASLLVAFAIGLGFGFFLERAGFGSARKLTDQFYFRDMAVFKVMFTAIVTAMVGLFLLAAMGQVDLSLVYLQPTWLWANIAGGLLLGFGFVIGGYCPGTSVVSVATGRIDAALYVLGVTAGMFVFGEAWPHIEPFAHAGDMGQITLPALLDARYGLLVFLVVLMAVGGFAAAEWAETRFGGKVRSEQPLIGPGWRTWNATRILLLTLALLGLAGSWVANPYRGSQVTLQVDELARLVQKEADHVTVDDLATWLVEGRTDFRLVDIRSADAYAAGSIPGAESIPLVDLVSSDLVPQDRVVLFGQGQTHAAQAWLLLSARGFPNVYSLLGGMDEWQDRILEPKLPAAPEGDQVAEVERRKALALHFGGTPYLLPAEGGASPTPVPMAAPPVVAPGAPAAAPPPKAAPAPAAPRKKKKEGC